MAVTALFGSNVARPTVATNACGSQKRAFSRSVIRPQAAGNCTHALSAPHRVGSTSTLAYVVKRQAAAFKAVAKATKTTTAAELDPDNASILVAGEGDMCVEVVRLLKDAGAWVWVLQKTDERRAEIEGMFGIVINGDATDADDLAKAFDQIEDVDAVVTVNAQGNVALMDSAVNAGVQKFVHVSMSGASDKAEAETHLQGLGEKLSYVIVDYDGETIADAASLISKTVWKDAANGKTVSAAAMEV